MQVKSHSSTYSSLHLRNQTFAPFAGQTLCSSAVWLALQTPGHQVSRSVLENLWSWPGCWQCFSKRLSTNLSPAKVNIATEFPEIIAHFHLKGKVWSHPSQKVTLCETSSSHPETFATFRQKNLFSKSDINWNLKGKTSLWRSIHQLDQVRSI